MRNFYAEHSITPLQSAKSLASDLITLLADKTDNHHMVLAMANLHANIAIAEGVQHLIEELKVSRNEKAFEEGEAVVRQFATGLGIQTGDAHFKYQRRMED